MTWSQVPFIVTDNMYPETQGWTVPVPQGQRKGLSAHIPPSTAVRSRRADDTLTAEETDILHYESATCRQTAESAPFSGAPPPPPCVTFCRVAVSLRGPGQSPVLPFACCVGSLRSVGRCGLCSCWCCFRVRGAQ